MSVKSFWKLSAELCPFITKVVGRNLAARNHVPNGPIVPSVRLAVALRYFASGSPYDIAPLYGLSITEAQDSIWYVVDAISMCLSFKMVYPDDSVTQQSIADGFKARSDAAFDCCAGAIDGILIWIHKPTRSECKEVKVDEGKFFCGR